MEHIFLWRYDKPYNVYDLYLNDYLKDILLKVYSWNTRAIKTYEKPGFVECDKLVRVEAGKTTEYSLMKMNIE